MPLLPGALHVDSYLTNLSVSWAQNQVNFISDKVFPTVPVQKQSDKYAIYPKGAFYRDEYKPRPLGGRPNQVTYDVTSKTYFCEEYGLEHKIDDRVRANADQPLDPDKAGMRLLTQQGMIRSDRMWATSYFKTGVWNADWTGVASGVTGNEFLQFDQADADPIGFFDERRESLGASGFPPNTLVLGPAAYRGLKNNASILDLIKFTQRGVLDTDLLAAMFGLDKVLVARGVYNTANEGQIDNIQYIVDSKSALLVYAAPEPAVDTPSGGYTFAWTGLIPGATNQMGAVIERGREELAHSDVLQGRMAVDPEIVAPELGEFYSACVA
jgi:hypothetical protein